MMEAIALRADSGGSMAQLCANSYPICLLRSDVPTVEVVLGAIRKPR
jgi:hypothetical protein